MAIAFLLELSTYSYYMGVMMAADEISVVNQLLELVCWKVDFTGEPTISSQN